MEAQLSPEYGKKATRLKQNLKTSVTIAALLAAAGGAVKGVSEFSDYREKQSTSAAEEAIKKALSTNPERYLIDPVKKLNTTLTAELWKPAGPDFRPGLKQLKIRVLQQPGKLSTTWHPTKPNELVIDPPVSADSNNEEGTVLTLDQFKDPSLREGFIAMNENTLIWESDSGNAFYGSTSIDCQKNNDDQKTPNETCHRTPLMVEFERDEAGKITIKNISILMFTDKVSGEAAVGRRVPIKDAISVDEQKLGIALGEALAKMQEYKALQTKSEDTQKILRPLNELTKRLSLELGRPVNLDFQPSIKPLKMKVLRRPGKPGDIKQPGPPFPAVEEEGTDIIFDSFERSEGGFIAINKNMMVWKDQSGSSEPLLIEFDQDYKGKLRVKEITTLKLIDREVKDINPGTSAAPAVTRKFPMKDKPQYDQQKLGSVLTEAQAKLAEYKTFLKGIEDIRKEEARKSKVPDHNKEVGFSLKLERGTVKIETTTAAWDGSRTSCTGWIAAPNVIGTARHCIEDRGHERLFTGVNRIVANGGQTAKILPIYSPKSSRDYAIAYPPKEDSRDIAVIVLNTPIFPPSDILKVRNKPVVSGNYFSAHFAGYDFPQIWKIDQGQVRSGYHTAFNFDFSNQGGNSGGPIVDFNGDVVSLHALSTSRDSTAHSEGPLITQLLMDELIKQAKGRIARIQK